MKNFENKKSLQAKNVGRVVTITALVLLVPFLAMQFNWQVTDPGSPTTETVNWNLFDFIVAGVLLLGVGITYEIFALKLSSKTHKVILATALLGVLFIIWIELAVGIFGSPFAGS